MDEKTFDRLVELKTMGYSLPFLAESYKAGVSADLREADLRGANLTGADLQEADLQGANLQGADLRGADLTKTNLCSVNLRWADLSNAKSVGANLTWATGNGREIKTIITSKYIVTWMTGYDMAIGCEQHPIAEWWEFDDERIREMALGAVEWWEKWKPIIRQLVEME